MHSSGEAGINSTSKADIILHVELSCEKCARKVHTILNAVDGVVKVTVDQEQQLVHVRPAEVEHISVPSSKFLVQLLRLAGFVAFENSEYEAARRQRRTLSVDHLEGAKHSTQSNISRKESFSDHHITSILISGMTCSNCVNTITNHLKTLPGIISADVSLILHHAVIKFDPTQISPPQIVEEIDDIGFEAKLPEINQSCTHEEQQVLTVRDESSENKEIDQMGKIASSQNEEINRWKKQLFVSLIFSIPVFTLSMLLPLIDSVEMFLMRPIYGELSLMGFLLWILASPVQFYVGRIFYKSAFKALLQKSSNMAVLVSIGTSAAYFYSFLALVFDAFQFSDVLRGGEHFFETTSTMITFVVLGKYLESIAKRKTSQALTKLMNLQADEACVVDLDSSSNVISEKRIPTSDLREYDIVKVLRGEKFPADGMIIKGTTSVQESMITGESMPQRRCEGDEVIGACINEENPVLVEILRVGSDTTLSKIVKLMENASMSKAPIQSFADTVSSYFVPSVILVSLFTFISWYTMSSLGLVSDSVLRGQNPLMFSFLFSIAVVTVACPCALGLATPAAVMVGTGVGARQGILIKGGASLEMAQKITTVVFDKTGTLTHGKPRVVDVKITRWFQVHGFDNEQVVLIAASAEKDSEHPLARAIVEEAKKRSIQLVNVQRFQAVSGRGLACQIDGQTVLIGSLGWMKVNSIEVDSASLGIMAAMEDKGHTAICVGLNGKLAAMFAVADTVRPESRRVIETLRKEGLEVLMLSGDNSRTARAIGRELNLRSENVIAEALPEDKLKKVQSLQNHHEGKYVAFVGDGINDSPALAQADLGISVGAGSDIAIEAAGMVLMRNNLSDLLTAIDLSKTTVRRIKWNFLWALLFNVAGIPLAAGVFYPWLGVRLSPEFAAMAMACSSLLVLTSSLLLNHYVSPYVDIANSTFSFDQTPSERIPLLEEDIKDDSERSSALECCGCDSCGKLGEKELQRLLSAAADVSSPNGGILLNEKDLDRVPNIALCSCSCPNCLCHRVPSFKELLSSPGTRSPSLRLR